MSFPNFTILTAVDDAHLNELVLTFKTWKKFKKEFSTNKIAVVYDTDQLTDKDIRFNDIISKNVELYPWKPSTEYNNQREKMLTAYIAAPNEFINTDWYIKIDTDTIASNNKKWIYEDWFDKGNVFISNPWGYTKPPYAIDILDDWGDNIRDIKNKPRLELHPKEGSRLVKHSRIISWIFVCNTYWSRQMARYSFFDDHYKLPLPSQDTYLVYLAQRLGYDFKKVRFKKFGWHHISKYRKLTAKYREIMDE